MSKTWLKWIERIGVSLQAGVLPFAATLAATYRNGENCFFGSPLLFSLAVGGFIAFFLLLLLTILGDGSEITEKEKKPT